MEIKIPLKFQRYILALNFTEIFTEILEILTQHDLQSY